MFGCIVGRIWEIVESYRRVGRRGGDDFEEYGNVFLRESGWVEGVVWKECEVWFVVEGVVCGECLFGESILGYWGEVVRCWKIKLYFGRKSLCF